MNHFFARISPNPKYKQTIMPLRPLLAAFAFFFISTANAQSISELAAKDEVIHISREEPAMRKAYARAAESLPQFLLLAAKPKLGTSGYMLKVAITDGKHTENFWVDQFAAQGDAFIGSLNNEPRLVMKHRLGERIRFSSAQIVDWMYIDEVGGKIIGNFTACALLTQQPAEQAAAFMREHGLTCEL
ncbi:DUF2314 domain-containing protein [Iodobacter sp. HSC-16F04]|uniref:DUF2314 domain-containing protein n=1 Tax=Iodobacter violaceini TaxID=3044271 RepID=A0ABX0KWU6_9NEIS|nr:DUF2314 domain-containing protein [Iodobacter violacea]NHQ85561.1 DUF2314 domain-containing protein [Iodobacter violacea]